MSLTNDQITAQNFKDFYAQIKPFLGGMPDILANKFSKADLYSTSEKIIGQWIDGKPLYQKCYSCTTPSSTSGYHTIITLDSNIEPKRIDGWLVQNNVPINCYASSSYRIITQYTASTHVIEQQVSGYTSKDEVVILRYTKTTDSPVEIGNDTDYSTTEKIVGTWIDGKPVYQKSYVKTTGLTNDAWVSMGNLPSNVSPIGVKTSTGICHTSPDDMTLPIPCYSSDESTSISINRNGIDIKLNRNSTSWDYACVTIQYTKTTD